MSEPAATAEIAPSEVWTSPFLVPSLYPWYWNDEVNPFNEQFYTRTEFHHLEGLHRALDANPDDQQIRLMLGDVHLDIGDELGGSYWQWMAAHDRRPDFMNGFWWWDNVLLEPNESRFRMPTPMFRLMTNLKVKLPKVRFKEGTDECIYPDPEWRQDQGYGCNVSLGDEITEIGFDGRLLAETTMLQAWRLMTDRERAKTKEWDYNYEDPNREGQ
jgi:hypothetical protein